MAQQTLDQLPQLLVLGLQLRHHFPQHPLQKIRIVISVYRRPRH